MSLTDGTLALRLASAEEPVWLPASLAALRSGYSSRHITRLCHKFAKSGMAMQDKLDAGRGEWLIREDADPKFAEAKPAQGIDREFSLANLPEKIQKVVTFRLRVLNLIETKRSEWVRGKKNFRNELKGYMRWLLDNEGIHGNKPNQPLATDNYYKWAKRLKENGQRGLVDNRMESAPKALIDDPFIAEVLRQWLTQQRRSVQKCYDNALDAAEENGWTTHPYKKVATVIFEWSKRNQTEVERLRFGRSAYVDNCKPFLQCDYSKMQSNEIWDSDHHQFDVWVQVGANPDGTPRFARPWLTSWQDLRSRKIVGHVISLNPNQDTVQLSFYRAIMSHGVPGEVLIDNGKDYDCFSLQGMTKTQRRKMKITCDAPAIHGLFVSLGVKTVHCEPYHGQGKPIERFHRTLKDRFCKDFATYCGGKPEERPDNCFTNMRNGLAPKLEEFTEQFGQWVEDDYHWRVHSGNSMDEKPAVVWENCLVTKVIPNPRTAELLKQRAIQARPVNQNGITWMGQVYKAPELSRRVGEELVIRVDHENTNQISVWELTSGDFICFASPKEMVPRNAARTEHLSEAMRELRSDSRVQRQMVGVRVRAGQSVARRAAAAAARKADAARAAQPPADPNPHSLRIAHTHLDDQMDRYEQLAELRQAVGSELGQRTQRSLEDLEGIYGDQQ